MDNGKGVGLTRDREQEKRFADTVAGELQGAAGSSNPDEWRLKLEARRIERALERLQYHKPRPDQLPKYQALRDAAAAFITVIIRNTPESSDALDAITTAERALMLANKAVALN